MIVKVVPPVQRCCDDVLYSSSGTNTMYPIYIKRISCCTEHHMFYSIHGHICQFISLSKCLSVSICVHLCLSVCIKFCAFSRLKLSVEKLIVRQYYCRYCRLSGTLPSGELCHDLPGSKLWHAAHYTSPRTGGVQQVGGERLLGHCPLAADLTKVRPAQQLRSSSISSKGRKSGGRKVVSEGIGELDFRAS